MMRTTAATPARRGGLSPAERAVRIVGGSLLAAAGGWLALGADGPATWAWIGAALLGLDFVVTGVRGYCPLYARLGLGRERR